MKIPRYKLVRKGSVAYKHAHGPIASPENAARVLWDLIGDEPRECLAVLFLDMGGRAIGVHQVGMGTLNFCPVSPLEVFGPAMLARAASIILAHNHPSGNTSPSQEDLEVFDRISKAGEILGIKVLDFLILGTESWESIKGRI